MVPARGLCYRRLFCARWHRGPTISTPETKQDASYPPSQVQRVEVDGREFILVGTAHVSRESAELVRRVIEQENPTGFVSSSTLNASKPSPKAAVGIARHQRSHQEKQLSTLMVNLMLSAYQKRLGLKLGVMPGTELLEATRAAEENDIPVSLCDRDVRVTLRRAWRATPF